MNKGAVHTCIASHSMVAANDERMNVIMIATVGVNQPACWKHSGAITCAYVCEMRKTQQTEYINRKYHARSGVVVEVETERPPERNRFLAKALAVAVEWRNCRISRAVHEPCY